MKTKTHFQFRLDRWGAASENNLDHIAGIDDFGWGRPNDTLGIAATVNRISSIHQDFLNAGGLGILVGDDQLPNPGTERIIEAYYSYGFTPSTRLTFDYQFITNPAYNKDRGPVSVFGGRVHTQF